MILVIDVGNTNMTYGVFDGKELKCSFRMTTENIRTSDEFGMEILALLNVNSIDKDEIEGVMIASVVPKVMHALVNAMKRYLNKKPYIVGPGIKTGIKICLDNPKEVGPDLIVDAVAAFEMYKEPVIVVDYGTATTFMMINEKGEFFTGVMCPGIRISAKALWQDTAKLPEIEIKDPGTILAKETISCMQAGLIYGQIGQTKYIINEMKKASGYTDAKVVATGGLGRLISSKTEEIDLYDPTLTLRGLQILYDKNRKTKPQLREFDNEDAAE